MSTDRFSASLRGAPLQASPIYQKVLRQPQRRNQSPSLSSFGSSSTRHADAHLVSQIASPTPLRPQTPPPTSRGITSANLARSISQRKGTTPAAVIAASSRSTSSLGVSTVQYHQPQAHSSLARGDEIQPAIAALERVLDEEIQDLRRVTEKLEHRVSSILSLEEHRQLLVRVAKVGTRDGSSAPSRHDDDQYYSDHRREAVNEVLLRVGAIQLGLPVPPTHNAGGSPRSLNHESSSSRNVDVEQSNAKRPFGAALEPFIVDLDQVAARHLPPPEPTPQPSVSRSQREVDAALSKREESASMSEALEGGRQSLPATAHASDEKSPEKRSEIPPEVCALITARLSSTELGLVEHQRELLALQSEVISLQRQHPDNPTLSRLRLLLRDELSMCKRRESRLADVETQFEKAQPAAVKQE